MRTNNCHVSHVSSDERVHWDVLEQEELRLASRHAAREADSPVVVTRHPALVEYLTELGVVPAGTEVVTHATAEQVRGRHVFGVLPLHLAAEAASVTEVTLRVPAELRGVELTLEQVRQFAGPLVEYKVSRV
jgi:putative CRISPR-associated protein (TIGR02620 family)